MSMGYQGEMAFVLDNEKVEALVAEPFAAFLTVLDKHEWNFNGFARAYSITDPIELENLGADEHLVLDEMLQSFSAVEKAFKDKTGLTLYVNYHNSQLDGDVQDEISGGFYCLDFNEVYRLTENARKVNEQVPIRFVHYVKDTTGVAIAVEKEQGTSYVACFSLPIRKEQMTSLVGKSFVEFLELLEKYGMSFDEFAEAAIEDVQEYAFPKMESTIDKEAATAEIIDAHTLLMEEIEKHTGLSIFVDFYDPKRGGKLDAISGGFYGLYFCDVFEKTEVAKAQEAIVPVGLRRFVVRS